MKRQFNPNLAQYFQRKNHTLKHIIKKVRVSPVFDLIHITRGTYNLSHHFCFCDLLITQKCTIVSNLEKSEKAVIKKIVCMWEGEALDVASHQFMTMLCDVNAESKKAEILLSADTNVYVTKKIADIIGSFTKL